MRRSVSMSRRSEPGASCSRSPTTSSDLRRETPELAEQWRSVVGRAFQAAFAAGYRAVHFVRDDSSGRRRSFYVLERV